MRTEIVLSGFGGQGLLMAGTILGTGCALYEGLNTTNSQAYGVQARGGESRSEVIVSDEEINYAEIEHPDVLLSMSQSALDRFAPQIRQGALVIIDSALVRDTNCVTNTDIIKSYPITEIAVKSTGKAILANVVALGIIAALTGIISYDNLKRAVLEKCPRGTEQLNERALESGFLVVKPS